MSRPSGAKTRHSWRSSVRVASAPSSPCYRQDAVEHGVGKGQRVLFAQRRKRPAGRRPGDDARLCRHQRHDPFGLAEIGPQIGRGKAVTEHAQPFELRPARPQAARNQPPRRLAQRCLVEFDKMAGVQLHDDCLRPSATGFNNGEALC